MIRIVIENLLLLLLPTLIYVAWVYLTGKTKSGRHTLSDAPFVWLFLSGLVLAISVLLFFGTLEGGSPGQAYRPPEFRDGKIVPGHVEDQPTQAERKKPANDG